MKKADKVIWGKMLIEVYKDIDDLIRVLELKVVDDCCNSNSYYTNYENTERQCESIIELIMRNDNLKKLKISIGNSINNLSKINKTVIICKDFKKNLRKELINKLDYTTKFYRLYENALSELFDVFFDIIPMSTFIENYSKEYLIKRCIEKAGRFSVKKLDDRDESIKVLLGLSVQ